MSKKYAKRKHVDHSGCTSSDEMCDSEDEICVVGEISPKSKREYCHSIIAVSDSEEEFTMKRRHEGCSNDSDSESEASKYLRMKKSRSEFYERRKNRQTDRQEELFVIDKKSQPLVKDEIHECEVCSLTFNIHDLYTKHMNSSSHKKAVTMMEARMRSTAKERYPEVNGHGSESRIVSDKYPPVPCGVKRLKINDESFIQQDVEKNNACPGLEHVIEIRGQKETSYFCGICDKAFYGKISIISHLKMDKHKLKSLKALKYEWYRILKTIPTRERKENLYHMLTSIAANEGVGRIVVERDYLDADFYKASQNLHTPGTSSDSASVVYSSNTNSSLVLSDCSKADYFCLVCECNMFDAELYESHAKIGLKNLRKYSVGSDNRIEIEKRPKSDAFFTDREAFPREPMIGLDFIREFQHFNTKKETYHCMLCGVCLTWVDITFHLTSTDHWKKYIEHIDHYSYDYIKNINTNDNQAFYRFQEICRKIQIDFGSGCPEVYVIKSKTNDSSWMSTSGKTSPHCMQ